jgi:hypothetical protein
MSNSFSVPDIAHIYGTIEDLFYMSEPPSLIKIAFGIDEEKHEFMKFDFRLKNGEVEVKIYEDYGSFSYVGRSGENLQLIEFDNEITSMTESFHQGLKDIIAFDRQQVTTAKITNTSVDRSSFGLAEVN